MAETQSEPESDGGDTFHADEMPTPDIFQELRLRGGDGRGIYAAESEDDEEEERQSIDGENELTPRARAHQNNRGGLFRSANGNANSGAAPVPGSNNDFEPGAIVRVRVQNFVTYERAEFHPGGRLNMIIGPNGTGKSSLVCAICLGLGYPASVLGRASSFGEFVKHGTDTATVEIELQKRPDEAENHVIRLRINQEDNSRKFWINGRECPHKAVQQLVRSLRIQVDNLCQFLPQDRVAEFAGLNPVELLTKTLQAAAAPEMITWQDELKKSFVDQKKIQTEHQSTAEDLRKMESRQQILQADVDKLREREEIQKNISVLENARIYRHYMDTRQHHNDAKKSMKDADRNMKRLQQSHAPSLRAVNEKEEYMSLVHAAVQSRTLALRRAETDADEAVKEIESIEGKYQDAEAALAAESESFQNTKKTLGQARKRIAELEAAHRRAPPPFEAAEWNTKIREQEHLEREKVNEMTELDEQIGRLRNQGVEKVNELKKLNNTLETLNSQQGVLLHHLEKLNPDTAKGYQWLQENQQAFEKTVFGPAMLTCNVKDKRYSDLIQSVLAEDDFLCFTAQTKADHKKLMDQFYGQMKLSVTIRTATAPYSAFQHPLPRERLREMGFDDYVNEFLEGPEPVLAMLCQRKALNSTPIGLNDIGDAQFERIQATEAIPQFAAARKVYRVMRRKEYGPDAVTTRVNQVNQGKFWTDEPVDNDEKERLRRSIAALIDEKKALEAEWQSKKEKKSAVEEARNTFAQKARDLRSQKAELQKESTKWQSLPDRIQSEKRAEKKAVEEMAESRKRRETCEDRKDEVLLQKANAILHHQEKIAAIRESYQTLIDAQIRLIEAKSDVRALKDKNVEITQQLEEEKRRVQELTNIVENLRNEARAALDQVNGLDMEDDERERVIAITGEKPLEEIQAEIEGERAKLDVIQASNPHALEEFQRRALDIQRAQRRQERVKEELDRIQAQIDEVRGKWEPRLDELVGRINDAFSYNFEQISCAGEVAVHKDEEFDKWAIEIRVRFRENETLQKLDQHRQSGGERAVSTIFYLMSLQSMAQAPFRVVDEINQGMDPRNERMVHERMVEIACREHTSQYFLFTPKLLSGLHYDEGMRVLCIASGPEMPVDGATRVNFGKIAQMQRQLMAEVRYQEPRLTV